MNFLTCAKDAWDTLMRTSGTTQPTTETKSTMTATDKTAYCRKCHKELTPETFLEDQEGCKTKRCGIRKQKNVDALMDLWKIEDMDELVPCESGEIVVAVDKQHNSYIIHDNDRMSDEELEYWKMMGNMEDLKYGGLVY